MIDVKERLKAILKARHMSVYALAQKAEVTQPSISNWFNNKNTNPNLSNIEKVANALEIPLSQLFMDEGEEFVPLDAESRELLTDWQKLSEEKRNVVRTVVKSYLPKSE